MTGKEIVFGCWSLILQTKTHYETAPKQKRRSARDWQKKNEKVTSVGQWYIYQVVCQLQTLVCLRLY